MGLDNIFNNPTQEELDQEQTTETTVEAKKSSNKKSNPNETKAKRKRKLLLEKIKVILKFFVDFKRFNCNFFFC